MSGCTPGGSGGATDAAMPDTRVDAAETYTEGGAPNPDAATDSGGADHETTSDATIDARPGTDAGASLTAYEAEDAFLMGALQVQTTPVGFSGRGVVNGWTNSGDGLVFTVNVASAGRTRCSLRYRNPGSAVAMLLVSVNGEPAGTSALPAAEGYITHDDQIDLRVGLNTIAYTVGASAAPNVAVDALQVAGDAALAARGATVPYTTYEAEDGRTNGAVIGPDRTYGTPAAEASQRKAIRLEADGAFVELTSAYPANAVVVRFSMPDAPGGGGTKGALDVYVGQEKRTTLALTSKYAWVYGGYPYGNDPGQGSPHRYFDEVRASIGDVPAGATVRFQRQPGDQAPYYLVDLIELETAPAPYTAPPGALSIDSYGATSGDSTDDTSALKAAIADAKAHGKDVWIPAGDYSLFSRVDVAGVTIRGAGPWHSVLHGSNGKGGFNGTGPQVRLIDFALFGDVSYRDDANFDAGVDGTLGPGSLIQNVWLEHTKVGIWTIAGNTALIVGCRIRDTFADGINLTNGTRRSMIEHVAIRNTGDDGIALWSTGTADASNVVRFASVSLPMLANGVALYGGSDNSVTDVVVADTVVASAGIAVSTRAEFSPLPFSGTTNVARGTLLRTGGYEPNWKTAFGGLWIFADGSALGPGLSVQDLDVLDSTYQGLLISGTKRVDGAQLARVRIDGASQVGIEIGSAGSGTFDAVTVSRAVPASMIAPGFDVTKDATSTGW